MGREEPQKSSVAKEKCDFSPRGGQRLASLCSHQHRAGARARPMGRSALSNANKEMSLWAGGLSNLLHSPTETQSRGPQEQAGDVLKGRSEGEAKCKGCEVLSPTGVRLSHIIN